MADAIFFTGVFAVISTSISALKYAYRSDPYPAPQLKEGANKQSALNKSPEKITGYTQHGLEQAMFRDGHGVSPKGILDAVRNPTEVVHDTARNTYKFVGIKSTTVLNQQGKIVSTWARSSIYWRY